MSTVLRRRKSSVLKKTFTNKMRDNKPFLTLVNRYFQEDPLRAAHAIETMSAEEAVEVIKGLPTTVATKTISLIDDGIASEILKKLPRSVFIKIAEHLPPQKAASIFLRLDQELRQSLIELLDEKKKKAITDILIFPQDSIGRIMSLDIIAFHDDVKVKDAIAKIRELAQKGAASSYVYVINPENKLIGVLNMRDMMLSNGDSILQTVMRSNIFSVNCFADREKVANEFSQRRFFAAPVVDQEGRLLGVVRAEQLIEEAQEEMAEDIQKIFGVDADEKAFSPISFSLRTRLPWLYVNLLTAFMAAMVVSVFQGVIAKITVLAVFLPVVAGQGGNAGAQSLAIVMRGIVMREIPPHKVRGLVMKETIIGIVNGLAIGVVTGIVAWIWHGNPMLGVVIGLGMLVNLTVAGFTGAMIPITLKAAGFDPAQCSNIILTTFTDCMGFFAFLGFAVLFQQYLL